MFTCEATERAVTEHDALVVADPNGRTAPAVAAIVWPAYKDTKTERSLRILALQLQASA